MTVSRGLKNLFKVMTGLDSKSSTAGDIINELSDNYTPSGGDEFVITYTISILDNSSTDGSGTITATADKAFTDIINAFKSDKKISAKIKVSEIPETFKGADVFGPSCYIAEITSDNFIITTNVVTCDKTESNPSIYIISHESGDVISCVIKSLDVV